MGYLRRFMETHKFHTLVPDQGIILEGPVNGPAKIRAMRAVDGSKMIVYTPKGEPFTLDQSIIKANYTEQSWYDPQYGTSYKFRSSPRACDMQTFQTYTPPTSGRGRDWVLVIQRIEQDSEDPSVNWRKT
jgi:hypothetical protein